MWWMSRDCSSTFRRGLSAYQERMEVLMGQMKETMQNEGIAYIGA